MNTYLYANANPLTFIDPDGLFTFTQNAFKRGAHRISTQDSAAISQFSNNLATTGAVTATAGPLVITGGGVAVRGLFNTGKELLNSCRAAISRNKDKIKEICKGGILAGSLFCRDAAGNDAMTDVLERSRATAEAARRANTHLPTPKVLIK
jgi:hypothetical protein